VKGSRPSERGPHGRPQALITDLESLGKTRDMDVELVLPGHGEPIFDHRGLIDERVAVHGRRVDKARLIA
jgi:glyoxylase-like metal-dependent hydrolase (beta-lactamase superfamily II)